MQLFQEAGAFAYVALAAFCAGLYLVVVQRSRQAPAFAAAILALGALGGGLGQRMVDRYLEGVPDLPTKIAVLSAGTREATANLVLSGLLALLLLGVATAAARLRGDAEVD